MKTMLVGLDFFGVGSFYCIFYEVNYNLHFDGQKKLKWAEKSLNIFESNKSV